MRGQMKVYYDKQWVLERNDGSVIRLSWNESSLLYEAIENARVWEEVAVRFEDDPHWPEIESAKDEIIEELRYDCLNLSGDAVWDAVTRYCDLDDPVTFMDENCEVNENESGHRT